MALPFKINKAKYDALSDEMKAEYIAGDKDGEFVLDVTDLPQGEDTGPIKRALESERNKNKALKTENDGLKTQIAEFPDVEALKTQHAAETKKYKDFTESALIDGAALALATKISNAPALLLPHIKSRLVADTSGDTPVTKVIGADGKPSDLTIEKLGEEFVANKDFAAIIVASKASGGGTPPIKPGSKPLGSGMQPKDGEQPKLISQMTPQERVAHIKAGKEAAASAQQ
jgi:hypothetical protein